LIIFGSHVKSISTIPSAGGDYRNFSFEEAGPIQIKFENVISWGTSGIESMARDQPLHPSLRSLQFSTIVYENPDRTIVMPKITQPKQTVQLYYEIAVLIIIVPAILFVFVIIMFKTGKPLSKYRKSTPI